MKNQIAIKLAALGLLALLVGCGAHNTQPAPATSSSSTTTTTTATTTGSISSCSSFTSTQVTLSGKLKADSTNSALIHFRITGLTSQFDNGSTSLQIFRWRADSTTGAVTLDSSPVTFTVQSPATSGLSATNLTSNLTSLTPSVISQLRSNSAISGTSAQDVLGQVDIVAQNLDLTWQAAKIVIYSGSTVIAQSDALLPPLYANPNTYAAHHSANLAQLHPLYSLRANLSDATALSDMQSYCF